MTEKQLVPQHVVDWIDYCKANDFLLLGALEPVGRFGEGLANDYKGNLPKTMSWVKRNQDEFARAWLNGYEAEKPTKYSVQIKGVKYTYAYLKYNSKYNYWYFSDATVGTAFSVYHTKEDLEKAGFGWVFSCDGVEVKEL